MRRSTHQLFLFAIVLVASVLRFWQIGALPAGFYFDEAFEGLEAWHILKDPTYRPLFLTGNFGVPPLNAYANAGMFWLFQHLGWPVGPTAMHATAACFGVLGVLALYGLAYELQQLDAPHFSLSTAFPLFAAAMLAVMRWHIHFSRMGIEPILTPLIWASSTWLFLRGWRTGHLLNFAGSGVTLAAGMYAYQAAWVIPFLFMPLTLLLLAQQMNQVAPRTITHAWRNLRLALRSQQGFGVLATVGIASLLFAPLAWLFWRHPNEFILRLSQVTAFDLPKATPKATIGQSTWATIKMYSLWGATGDLNLRRNLPGAPVLNIWQALPFYVGGGLAVWRIRRPSYAIPLLGLIGLLLPGALSSHAPHFYRTLGASAPTALLCAVGLDCLWQWRPKRVGFPQCQSQAWRSRAGQLGWVSLFLVILGGTTSVHDYFGRWATQPDLYNAFRVGLWQISQQITTLPPNLPVYMTLSDVNYPTVAFALQTHEHPAPITFDGRHILPMTGQATAQPEQYIVLMEKNQHTTQLLPKLFPNVIIQQELHDWQGHVYARYYVRPKASVPQPILQYPRHATLGDGIALLGYDLRAAAIPRGKNLYMQLYWDVAATPTTDWNIFTRIVRKDPFGSARALVTYTNRPGKGSLPTNHWQKGWQLLDEYKLRIPTDLQPGQYELEIGLDQASGKQLTPTHELVLLGTVKID